MKVVVIGGGFGGLATVRALENAEVEVTLIDRTNFHLFQPLLYQVATGALSPANIASPLRSVLRKQRNARVLLGEVTGFDVQARQVVLEDWSEDYDVLVIATGSAYNYFGHPEWERLAPSLKTLEDATEIRARVLSAFEQAEIASDASERESLMTFVVIGGGTTGVELAGALAELARYTLSGDFRRISAGEARILLLEADGRILPGYPESLARYATASLNRLGVELRVNTRVVDVDEQGVTVTTPDGEERIEARTLLWAAGVRGTEAGNALVEECGMPPAPAGRIAVTPQLTVPGHPDIFVIGDLAFVEQDGRPLPAVAPVAMQQGAYVADVIRRRLAGEAAPPFRYRDRGSMATIGRASAVADLGRVKLQGFAGWVAWLLVHLMMLVRFENKVLVLMQWTWSHFTHGRSARLITGRSPTAHRNPSRTGTG